jgi:flagellar hook protein FlgE
MEGSQTGFLGTVQLAADYAVHELYQDGFTTGSLQSLNINKDGKISALFGNGQTRMLGQVVLAKFTAPTELARVGENMLAETFESGDAVISGAASNSLGKVLSNTLELSNVDLSEEFIKMISYQRAFQANTRTITTTDEMLQELLTLKR